MTVQEHVDEMIEGLRQSVDRLDAMTANAWPTQATEDMLVRIEHYVTALRAIVGKSDLSSPGDDPGQCVKCGASPYEGHECGTPSTTNSNSRNFAGPLYAVKAVNVHDDYATVYFEDGGLVDVSTVFDFRKTSKPEVTCFECGGSGESEVLDSDDITDFDCETCGGSGIVYLATPHDVEEYVRELVELLQIQRGYLERQELERPPLYQVKDGVNFSGESTELQRVRRIGELEEWPTGELVGEFVLTLNATIEDKFDWSERQKIILKALELMI